MYKIGRIVCACVLGVLLPTMSHQASAQTLAVKTNLLHDVLLSPSLGVELVTGDRGSVHVAGTYNPFGSSERKWRNWSVQPEYRFWMHQAMTGPFVGVNAVAGGYNIAGLDILGLGDKHRQGTFYGAGLSAGWHQILSTRWSLELTLGADYVRTTYDRYADGDHEGRFSGNLVLPTGSGVTLVYIIR